MQELMHFKPLFCIDKETDNDLWLQTFGWWMKEYTESITEINIITLQVDIAPEKKSIS